MNSCCQCLSGGDWLAVSLFDDESDVAAAEARNSSEGSEQEQQRRRAMGSELRRGRSDHAMHIEEGNRLFMHFIHTFIKYM